jgi:xanthine dehydrogenase accessory factor
LRVLELLDTIRAWQREGRSVAMATLVDVVRSAPRDPGAVFAVCDDGRLAGSISGGCVEAALVDEATEALRDGRARVVSYGLSDSEAQAVGLTCGGTLRILVERLDPAFCEQLERERSDLVALVVRLDDAARLAVLREQCIGTLGNADLDEVVADEAREGHASEQPRLRIVPCHPEEAALAQPSRRTHTDLELFITSVVATPDMYVFGAIDFANAVVGIGRLLGYRVTICDARPAFASRGRFPQADRVVVAWPHEFLATAPIDERTAIVLLTHDEKFDVPAIREALRSKAGYIGAMGSRRTHEHRVAQLREAGVSEEQLTRLNAPIGLDIGARTPEETAVAIAAEIIALRHGRSGGRLTGKEGSLRGRPKTRA